LTELNYTYSKNSNNITRNSVLRRSVAFCGVLRSLDGPDEVSTNKCPNTNKTRHKKTINTPKCKY